MDTRETGSSGFGGRFGGGFGPQMRDVQGAWRARVSRGNPLQRLLAAVVLLLMLGVGVVLGVVFLAVGLVAAVVIAAVLLVRRAVRAVTGGGREALHNARGVDGEGRRNVSVIER